MAKKKRVSPTPPNKVQSAPVETCPDSSRTLGNEDSTEYGILLLEVNRMLRAGGYFACAAQHVYKHEAALEEQWQEMVDLTTRLCWMLVKKEGYIAIRQKPFNNSCYYSREKGAHPPMCEPDDDPDKV